VRLNKALEDKQLDVRLRDKLVTEGKLTKSQVEEYYKSLPDDQTLATVTGGEGERDESLRQSQ
jgi:hypothetical protein